MILREYKIPNADTDPDITATLVTLVLADINRPNDVNTVYLRLDTNSGVGELQIEVSQDVTNLVIGTAFVHNGVLIDLDTTPIKLAPDRVVLTRLNTIGSGLDLIVSMIAG